MYGTLEYLWVISSARLALLKRMFLENWIVRGTIACANTITRFFANALKFTRAAFYWIIGIYVFGFIPVSLFVSLWPYSGVVLALILLLFCWLWQIFMSIAAYMDTEDFKERYDFWYGLDDGLQDGQL